MARWRKIGHLERQLRDDRPAPDDGLLDRIAGTIDDSRRSRVRPYRPALAAAATAVMLLFVASLGGVARAADSVQSVISIVSGGSTSSSTSGPSVQCQVDVPCGFTVNPTATKNHMDSSQVSQDTDNKVHIIPGSFTGAVALSFTVNNTCGGSNAGISLTFADNPIPSGQNFTGFTITTSGAAVGVYTLTITGTRGSETESGTATLVVGKSNKC